MGLSNAATRARNYNSIINQNQGGGNKKAGLPYQIGREWHTSITLHSTDPVGGKCCTLKQQMTMKFTQSNYQARGVGVRPDVNPGYYRPYH
jgi:hypothetical protein